MVDNKSIRASRLAAKKICIEKYQAYYNNPCSSAPLNVSQFNEILHLHGYFMLSHGDRQKDKIIKALSGIGNLINPHRSTLNEAPSSCNPCLTLDEVNTDLSALNWQEDSPVESLEFVSFTKNNTDVITHTGGITEKERKTMVKKGKETKVFDAIHLTKPRSKNNRVKRKRLSDIFDIGRVSTKCSSMNNCLKRKRLSGIFDIGHVSTKPRSMTKCVKRKRLYDILDFGRVSAGFS